MPNNRYTSISVEQIPVDIEFDGYLWFSDQQKPTMLMNQRLNMALFKKLPFIIEGNLWSKERQLSVNIRNFDGQYLITSFDLSNSSEDILLEEKNYIAHDLEGVTKFQVIEAWEEKEDEALAGMKTLVPSWTAFKGFIKIKSK